MTRLHDQTPPPEPVLHYRRKEFAHPEPEAPPEHPYHRLWKLLPWHRRRIDQENEGSGAGIEEFMSAHLAKLQWPQDTAVDLKFDPEQGCAYLDVDFPEIEDLPEGIPEPAPRTRELRIKRFSNAARRRLYAAHIHSALFRLIGEAFRTSPAVREVVASGYSQRPDPATGTIQDEYLISVRVERDVWNGIDFTNLEQVDPIEALARFPHVHKMTKTGIFRRIDPID